MQSLGWEYSPGEGKGTHSSIPVFWPGEFDGQRSLAVYSPWVTKSWTQYMNDFHIYIYIHTYIYVCVCVCVCVCVYIYTHIYVCVCVYIYIYICIYMVINRALSEVEKYLSLSKQFPSLLLS